MIKPSFLKEIIVKDNNLIFRESNENDHLYNIQ